MSTTSTIPAAIDALVTLGATVVAPAILPLLADGETIQVVDSGAQSDGSRTQLVIAYAAGSGSDAVQDTSTISGLRVDRDNETYSIACLASTWVGNGAFKAPRDLAYAVVDAMHDAIAADKTLGRVVMQARVAEAPYVPTLAGDGPTVSVPFRVLIEARRAAQ